jgi:hypothetical protein
MYLHLHQYNAESISHLNSAIITISVGPSQRLFAAHEDILCKSTHFAQQCRAQFFEASGKRIELPNEEPEIFSAVLEYLYKGDYAPKIAFDKKRASWYLQDVENPGGEITLHQNSVNGSVLKDTIVYASFIHTRCTYLQPTNDSTVRWLSLRSPRTATPRTKEARPSVWCPMQHDPGIRSLRIREHSDQRF